MKALVSLMVLGIVGCSSVLQATVKIAPQCALSVVRPGEFQCLTYSVGCMNSDALRTTANDGVPVCRIKGAW